MMNCLLSSSSRQGPRNSRWYVRQRRSTQSGPASAPRRRAAGADAAIHGSRSVHYVHEAA
eukprot:1978097-Pleurochrysis_carterae.AAC.2